MNEQRLITMDMPPMPYYITTGLSSFQPGEQHPSRHNLGVFDLLWVIEGTLYIGEEEQQWALTSGQTVLLLPDRYHYAVKPCDTTTRFYWNHFDFGGNWQQTEQAESPVHPVRNAWNNSHRIRVRQHAAPAEFVLAERHLRQLLSYASQRPGDAFWQEQQLFMELLRLLEVGYRGKDDSPALKLAEQTEAYLRQHFQTDVTNEALAEVFHFHPNYIVRCMKEVYHCTPMEYLHEYRLEQAKLLLIKTEWPISHIAEHVGFHYAPYFSRCFKQYTGMPPLRFRKQYMP